MKRILHLAFGLSFGIANAQVRILFDATKAETAGNADWVIDADLHNLGFNNGPAVVGQGSESNPVLVPTPAQSGITASTPESYWNGGISYWGVDCAREGYVVQTLPYNGRITYGDGTNTQDLSNYQVYIVCEPNILFTAAEKTAIVHFVQNGGGLFMISDHDVSDRNGDGDDSPHIWNDLISNNSVQANPFGITFDYQNYSQTSSNIANLPTDSILHGSYGSVTQVQWSNGTTMTLSTAANATVKGLVYKSGSSTTGTTNVFCARSRYGRGKVVAIGDSSPCDDGSGDPNDVLYDGYITDANGNHRKLLMNATIWLATNDSLLAGTATTDFAGHAWSLYPNPSSSRLVVKGFLPKNETVEIQIFDITGKCLGAPEVREAEGYFSLPLDISTLENGTYLLRLLTPEGSVTSRFMVLK